MTVANKERIKKSPIENKSMLCEAYDYPEKFSFSRGMRVELDNCTMLFISGTASVNENGDTVHPGDIVRQAQRQSVVRQFSGSKRPFDIDGNYFVCNVL